MAEHKRFRIIWRNAAYYVSIPEYNGGEVVDVESYDSVLSDLEAMREKYEAMRDAHGITLMARNQDEAELDRLRKALERFCKCTPGKYEGTCTACLALNPQPTTEEK